MIADVPRILYVDNDTASRASFSRWLDQNERGYHLTCAGDAAEALDKIRTRPFDLYLFEYCLGAMTGPELCRRIRLGDQTTPVIICSALSREIDRNTALSAGASSYLIKPDELPTLSATMRRVLSGLPYSRRRYHTLRRSAAII